MRVKTSLVLRLATVNLLLLFSCAALTYFATSYFKNEAFQREEENRMKNLVFSSATTLKNIMAADDYPSLVKPIQDILRNNTDAALITVKNQEGENVFVSDRALLKVLKKQVPKKKDASLTTYFDPSSGRPIRAISSAFTQRGHIFGSMALYYYPSSPLEKEREKNFIALGQSIVSSVAELFANLQYFELSELTQNLIHGHKDIAYSTVVTTENFAIFHTNAKLRKKILTDALSKNAMKGATLSRPVFIQRTKVKSDKFVDISILIEKDGQKLGLLRLGYSLKSLRKQEVQERVRLFLFTLLLSFAGIVIVALLARQIAGPIVHLSRLSQKVGAGDLEVKADIPKTKDEVALLAHSFNDMIVGLKERERVKDMFSRYVSKDVAKKLLETKGELELGGERRKVTIMYADVRGFTSLSENLKPEEVVLLLNEYFDIMVDVVFKHEGALDKFIGDCIMAVFGTPIYHEDDAERAVRSASDMQKRITDFNRQRRKENKREIDVGIGINTGYAVAGNIGTKERLDYTVIGDTVNTASRIQGLAQGGEIVISSSTYFELKDKAEVIALPPITVKGKKEPLEVYKLLRFAEDEKKAREAEYEKSI